MQDITSDTRRKCNDVAPAASIDQQQLALTAAVRTSAAVGDAVAIDVTMTLKRFELANAFVRHAFNGAERL